MFSTGVNDTGNKLFSGVNDTGEKFIAGVVDTGEQFITGDNDTGDNFVAGDNDTGEQLSPVTTTASSLGRYVFGSEISYNKAPPRLPGLGC